MQESLLLHASWLGQGSSGNFKILSKRFIHLHFYPSQPHQCIEQDSPKKFSMDGGGGGMRLYGMFGGIFHCFFLSFLEANT